MNTLERQKGVQSQVEEIKVATRNHCDQFYANALDHAYCSRYRLLLYRCYDTLRNALLCFDMI